MKVLVCHRPGGAFGYISDGWINVMREVGIAVARWDGNVATFNEFDPDLYIGCSGHRQEIPVHKYHRTTRCKVALHVNPCCDTKIKPNINESQEAIDWVVAKSPDVVFGYGFEFHRQYWSHWETKHNIPWVPMPTAGDSTIYKVTNGSHKKHDAAYVGGYWPYKAQNIDKYLLPSLKHVECVVRGWGKWPVKAGNITDVEVAPLLANCKVGPCISEPHTTRYGIDIPERVFKVILSGALAVHDFVPQLDSIGISVPVELTPEGFLYTIEKFIKNDKEREECQQLQLMGVLDNHTYFHRMATLFRSLGFEPEADKLLETAGQNAIQYANSSC